MLDAEINTLTLQRYVPRKVAIQLRQALDTTRAITRPVEYVVYRQGRFTIRTSDLVHWTLSDVWDRIEEVFGASETDTKSNLENWGLLARIVIWELQEIIRNKR